MIYQIMLSIFELHSKNIIHDEINSDNIIYFNKRWCLKLSKLSHLYEQTKENKYYLLKDINSFC